MKKSLHVGNVAAAGCVAVGHVLGWMQRGQGGQEGVRVQSSLKWVGLWHQGWGGDQGGLCEGMGEGVHRGLCVHLIATGSFLWGGSGLGQWL